MLKLKMSAVITVILLLGSFETQAHGIDGGVPEGCLGNSYDFRKSEYKCQIKVISGQNTKSYDFDDILSSDLSEWDGAYPESDYIPYSRGYEGYMTYKSLKESHFSLQAYGNCPWHTGKPNTSSASIKLVSPGSTNSLRVSWEVELETPAILTNGINLASVQVDKNNTVQVSCQKR